MGKSSKDKRDAYYRLAKEEGWRARSAYKLLQLDEEFNLFEGVTRVVDLCAAPGSWSQVLSRVLIKGEKFGRAGLQEKQAATRSYVLGQSKPSSPLSNAEKDGTTVSKEEGEDKSPKPREGHHTLLPVDLVISDGAPDVTGLHDLDIYVQSQLLWAALNLALCVLKPGGKFVAKIFRGKDVDLLFAQLKIVFKRVRVAKPRSSRASSIEAFVVLPVPPPKEAAKRGEESKAARRVRDDGVVELDLGSESEDGEDDEDAEEGGQRWIAPFLACGDLSAYDSDATYNLPKDRVSLDPVQPPTAPPYKRALEMRKLAGGAYGKTKGRESKDAA
ncbi:tRNA (uridine-2'-O-)-methyltransferase trm7 [Neocucurbitaria cava]|uniref:tRNA (Uridine-2'-O-)-methyltransferase trm7 n=1 Tax=Neocucurbitaria cava TaxID=798079 RepID=A0A9W8YIL5_9PLEO|nr:tRNA (uridine-2'-O-)-methyltransferase trm7 [Neocucurbitaria cava]